MTIHLLQETLQIRRLLQEVLNLVSFYLTVCLPSSTLTRNCVLSCAISCAILCNIPCYPVKSCEYLVISVFYKISADPEKRSYLAAQSTKLQ